MPSTSTPGGSLILETNGQRHTLNGAAADLARRIMKFATLLADPDFDGTFIYKIHHGQLTEAKFEHP